MPRVVLAPDKFKGTLTAVEVVEHVGAGLNASIPDVELVSVPVADGGDGTLAAAYAGAFEPVVCTASGPTGERLTTAFARRGNQAVIELAAVSGLSHLPSGLQPMRATSGGAGDLVREALEVGCREILLGIGGSASTDGGSGLMTALGARVLDADGQPVPPGGRGLARAAQLDLSGLDPRLRDTRLVIACDVDNTLLGTKGAAVVYGPQKGATALEVSELERSLARWADLVATTTGIDLRDAAGGGAAGGVGFAAVALLGATIASGAGVVLELTRFAERTVGADLVVTGEGCLDEQTLYGKAPHGVARAARRLGVPVVAVAGRCTLDSEQLAGAGISAVYALTDLTGDESLLFGDPSSLLRLTGERIARKHLSAGLTHR